MIEMRDPKRESKVHLNPIYYLGKWADWMDEKPVKRGALVIVVGLAAILFATQVLPGLLGHPVPAPQLPPDLRGR